MKLSRYLEAKNYVYTPFTTGIKLRKDDKFNDEWFGSDDFLVIAAGTGIGKSYIAMYMSMNIAKNGKRVLFFNFENHPAVFVKNMLQMGFDFEKDFGGFGEDELSRFMVVHSQDYAKPITFEQIRKKVELCKPDLVVIDLFSGLIPQDNISVIGTQYAIALSQFPKEYNCAVMTTEQYKKDHRNSERADEKSIGGSRALTDKATKVFTFFNYYKGNPHKAVRERLRAVDNTLELIVCKDRNSRADLGIEYIYKDNGYRRPTLQEMSVYMDTVFPEKKIGGGY